MSSKKFCDVCEEELAENMVNDRLVVERGEFKAEVIITKNGTANAGDLCYDCLIVMLTTKSRKTRKDKNTHRTKVEPTGPGQEHFTSAVEGKS